MGKPQKTPVRMGYALACTCGCCGCGCGLMSGHSVARPDEREILEGYTDALRTDPVGLDECPKDLQAFSK